MRKQNTRILVKASLAVAAAFAAACSSGSSPCNDGMITVYNFDNWCTVSLNGAATNVSSSYRACVPSGNSTTIVLGPASSTFELGPKPFVLIGAELPDGGGAPPGTVVGDGGFGSTSTVQVGISGSAACVLVCCPFTDGTGCDSSQSGYTAFLSDCP
jgi:hypothetical protein